MTEKSEVITEKPQPVNDSENLKKSKMPPSNTKIGLFMGFGAFCVVLGAIAVVFWPPLFLSLLRNMLILSPTSQSYEIWSDVPIPMYLECYLFNITNVEDIRAGRNVKIQVEEIGPYVYRENHRREDIEWNDDNSTVSYFNVRQWEFMPEMSNASLSDIIVNINPIAVTIASIVRHQSRAVRFGADIMMRMFHEDLFITANATSWIFDGIEDEIIDLADKIPDFPIYIPYEKFAWFYDRNASKWYDGHFNMNTGKDDFYKLGNVEMWKYSNRTVYPGECGEVRGSTGELWAPEFDQPEVEVFLPDVCTYLTLTNNKTVEIEGVEGVEYNSDLSFFDNGWNYPSKACFCDEERTHESCPPVGALNISSCRYGAPALVSLPHFLDSDPYYPSKIEGLHPTEDHRFRLSLEMFTGMPLEVRAQLQINMLVRHIDAISLNNQLPDPDVLVPMMWFRQEVSITSEYISLAKFALNTRYGMPWAFYAITAIGIALLITGIALLYKRLIRSPDNAPILSTSSSSQDVGQ